VLQNINNGVQEKDESEKGRKPAQRPNQYSRGVIVAKKLLPGPWGKTRKSDEASKKEKKKSWPRKEKNWITPLPKKNSGIPGFPRRKEEDGIAVLEGR